MHCRLHENDFGYVSLLCVVLSDQTVDLLSGHLQDSSFSILAFKSVESVIIRKGAQA